MNNTLKNERRGCSVCGDKLIYIRGRNPGDDNREVCPTCLSEKMDMIREISDKNYGQAYTTNDTEKLI